MYWRFYAPENTHYNLRKLCACVTQSYCFSSPIWTFLAPVIVLFDHQLHTHCFMISERVVQKYFKENWKIQTLWKFVGVRRGDVGSCNVGSIFCLFVYILFSQLELSDYLFNVTMSSEYTKAQSTKLSSGKVYLWVHHFWDCGKTKL